MKTWTKVFIGVMIIVISVIAFGIYSRFNTSRAFIEINKEFEEQSYIQIETNEMLYEKLGNDSLKQRARKLQIIFKDFDDSLDQFKQELNLLIDPKTMKNKKFIVNDYFFSNDEISQKGKDYINLMSSFQEELKLFPEVYENDHILNLVTRIYNKEIITYDNRSIPWMEYHYKDFPFISSITRISSLQNDAILIEKAILKTYLDSSP